MIKNLKTTIIKNYTHITSLNKYSTGVWIFRLLSIRTICPHRMIGVI